MSSIENYTGIYLRSGAIFDAGQEFANDVRESASKDSGIWEHKLVVTSPSQHLIEEYGVNPYSMTALQMMEVVINTRHATAGSNVKDQPPVDLETAEFQIQSTNTAVSVASMLLARHPFDPAQIERRVTGMTLNQNIVPTKLSHVSLGSWTVGLTLVDPGVAVFKMSDSNEMDVFDLQEQMKITRQSLEYVAELGGLDLQNRIPHGLIIAKQDL